MSTVSSRLTRLPVWFTLAGLLCLPPAGRAAAPAPDIRRDATVEAIEKLLPSIVNIGTETLTERRGPLDDLMREFYGPSYRAQKQRSYSVGSGVIIDESGFILTNDHVVRQATKIWVKLHDGREFETERVAFTSQSDVALLRIRAKPGEKFKAAKFAADDDLLLGETVIALGNPFGLGGSVARGILSSKNRRPPMENLPLDVADWLQTDAAINPGSSGGPLVNLRGEIIGINVAVVREGQGIGFALPIKRVTEALSDIFTPEELRGLWFGAKIKAGAHPLTVMEVQPGSPSEKAGLKKGDVLIGINEEIPRNFIEFSQTLTALGEKGEVTLAVRRDGERKTLPVKLVSEKTFFNADLIRQRTGITFQESLTNSPGSRVPTLAIKAVEKDSPAAIAGMEAGMLISGIAGQPIEDITAVAKILNARKKGDTVKLDFLLRRGNFLYTANVGVKIR